MIPLKMFCARYPTGATWKRTRFVYGYSMRELLGRIPVGKEFEFVKLVAPKRRYGQRSTAKTWGEYR